MVIYKFLIAVYIDEKDTEKLRDLCFEHGLDFENLEPDINDDPEWQEYYRRETGFSGVIKRCWITYRTVDKNGISVMYDVFDKADFDMMVNIEIS